MIHEDNGPVFPVVIFPENIRKIIDTTHEESCFPVNYIAAALYFAASVAVGNYRTLEANSFKAKAEYCFQSFRLVFSSFQRLGQKPRFLSQLVYLLELHDIQHREQDAVYLGIPTLVEVTVIPMGHWMSG